MSTSFSSNTIKLNDNARLRFTLSKKQKTLIKSFVLLAIIISIAFFNIWIGLALALTFGLYLSRNFISLCIYILNLDLDFDEAIFEDLESI